MSGKGYFTTDDLIFYSTGQLYFNVKRIFMQNCNDKNNLQWDTCKHKQSLLIQHLKHFWNTLFHRLLKPIHHNNVAASTGIQNNKNNREYKTIKQLSVYVI